jgi:hypothetical protein
MNEKRERSSTLLLSSQKASRLSPWRSQKAR